MNYTEKFLYRYEMNLSVIEPQRVVTKKEIFNHLEISENVISGMIAILDIHPHLQAKVWADYMKHEQERKEMLDYLIKHPTSNFNPKNRAYKNKLKTLNNLKNQLFTI